MTESFRNRTIYSLHEVSLQIQRAIESRFDRAVWIKAEMNKLNYYPQSGHCYPELLEKKQGKVIAQMRANLWRSDYQLINDKFLKVLREPLKDGIGILFLASITYHPQYGLSLRIIDIDPSYSLGELEREKMETIERLTKEGLYGKNKSLRLPMLPGRLALISVETSKGYSDFIQVIDRNPWGYRFFHMLFPALLQGERSVTTILEQLKRIARVRGHFDAVAIIRGGGGDTGLSSYNNYDLCKAICEFPLPVITGIGHSTNETVAEMVSFKNAITPTELADYLIQKYHNFSVPIQKARESIMERSRLILMESDKNLVNTVRFFRSATRERIGRENSAVREKASGLSGHSRYFIANRMESQRFLALSMEGASRTFLSALSGELKSSAVSIRKDIRNLLGTQGMKLEYTAKQVEQMDPVNVLRRGYSITLHNGKALKDSSDVVRGEVLTTRLAKGTLESEVKNMNE